MRTKQSFPRLAAGLALLALVAGCAQMRQANEGRTTKRDKTKKGAAIGAAAGAVVGILGEGEADDILAGAAVGAAIGGGVGAYMDRQEEKLARIPGTSVERVGNDMLLLHLDSDVLFAVDSAVLSHGSQASLDQVAGVLNEYPKTAIVAQGHTDSTGNEIHNQSLSERRAQAVTNFLIGEGIDSDRIVAVGFGEGHPIASNDSESGRSQNRRVDLLLKAKAT